jgi:hypothetical protein
MASAFVLNGRESENPPVSSGSVAMRVFGDPVRPVVPVPRRSYPERVAFVRHHPSRGPGDAPVRVADCLGVVGCAAVVDCLFCLDRLSSYPPSSMSTAESKSTFSGRKTDQGWIRPGYDFQGSTFSFHGAFRMPQTVQPECLYFCARPDCRRPPPYAVLAI